MKRSASGLAILGVIALGLLAGWWLGREAVEPSAADAAKASPPPRERPFTDSPRPDYKTGDRTKIHDRFGDPDAPPGALRGQRTITFSDAEAMQRFLDSLHGTGIALLGRIDALNTVRVALLDPSALDALLDGSEDLGYIFPAFIPGEGSIQPGALGFGSSFLQYLGADGDRSGRGAGVKIAVLDTGVLADSRFPGRVFSENLVELPSDLSQLNNHGTAVAGLIASEVGLAPDATLLSYRIAADDGTSDTFLIAEAVISAADAGADIINISLGSTSRSVLLENAISYATEAGVVIVASVGNNGIDYVTYPAAFDSVIGVGANDANGSHLDFSNSGDVAITAPGLALTTPSIHDDYVNFSGTSASSPVVAGAIATVMTEFQVSAQTAWEMLAAHANEAGAAGDDPQYGAGLLDVGRVLRSETPGINDMALASNYLTVDDNGQYLVEVTVENRGTETVVNAPVSVTTPLGISQLNVTTLPPGGTQTFKLPVGTLGEEARIDSSVGISSGDVDGNPANNRRVDVVSPPDPS